MTSAESLLIGDIVVQVVRSARRRTLTLEVGERGVLARAPTRMKLASINEFIVQKQDWLTRHVAKLPKPEPEFRFENGAKLNFLGESYYLAIQPGSRKAVQLTNNCIVVPVLKTHLDLKQTAHNKLIRWYKSRALLEIQSLVDAYKQSMNVPAQKALQINVREYKRRWGSCGYDGQLSFNWRIAQAPREVIEYIVVHELAHCHEFNHSPRFWQIVSHHLPDWKQQQHWLHQYGASLYRI